MTFEATNLVKLFDVSTGDTVTEQEYVKLNSLGLLNQGQKAPSGEMYAKLTPKADKLIRGKLSN